MSKLTFGFIVGGDDKYYKNLMRACESLERVEQDHEILILDMDNRLEIDDPKVKIVYSDKDKLEERYIKNGGDDRNWFQPHAWAERYNLYKHVETDYCIYLDTDCVVINDRTDELIEESEDQFLVAQHWWVPTLNDYLRMVPVDQTGLGKYLPKMILSICMLLLVLSFSRRISMWICSLVTMRSIKISLVTMEFIKVSLTNLFFVLQ